MANKPRPVRILHSVAPIRICDNGGWTDTWFARYGKVFNIAVYPYAEVQIKIHPEPAQKNRPKDRVTIHAEDFGERYAVNPDSFNYDRHPLLEAAIKKMSIPENLFVEVNIHSEAPAGCSTGTSAAVSVALIGALDRLRNGNLTPLEISKMAHNIETEMLGQQCGIQDQICSALGGINFIEMDEYPKSRVTSIQISDEKWWELESRLSLIYLGRSHSSTEVHKSVISRLENAGPGDSRLEKLRDLAEKAKTALSAGNLDQFGETLSENTEAQRDLHPELISSDAQKVIDIAKKFRARGWKVNGAGGNGGSLTIFSGPDYSEKRKMLQEIVQADPLFRMIPIYLSRRGIRVWETQSMSV